MPTHRASPARAHEHPTLSEIAALVGGDDPAKHTAILATGATFAEIEQALAVARGEGETLGEAPHPLAGRVAAVYEILAADAEEDET